MQRQSRQPDAQSRHSRPWLLLWLLPYLSFCLAGDGWHNHSLGQPTASASPAASLQVVKQQSRHQPTQCSLHAAEKAEAKTECAACQWLSNSLAALHTPNAALAPSAPQQCEL
ncbi:MAG: hypothetical protein M3347_19235, partial [Armatimonadota bacterium]|nr:hypothetical protein [Armatimonadota bacterium]